MPIANNAFRIRLAELAVDGRITAEERFSIERGQLSDAQKLSLQGILKPQDFPDPALAQAQLEALGLIGPAPVAPRVEDGLGAKLKGEVEKLAKKELFKGRDFTVLELKGDWAGVALRVNAQLIDPKDPLIREDANRTATTARSRAAGESLSWARVGGGLFPQVGAGGTIPLLGGSVSFGFSANSSLAYSVLAPYPHEAEAALALAKNLSVDLPFSGRKAKALIEGTEVLLRGAGQVAAHAGLGIGKSAGNELVKVGASLYGGIGYTKSGELALRIKRLDGGKVYVSVSRLESRQQVVDGGAHVGVDLRLKDQLPDLGGGLYQKAGELLAGQVEKQVEKWLSLDFRGAHTSGKSERQVGNYVFDLYDPDAIKAYEALIKLDARAADELVAQGNPACRSAKLSEETRSVSRTLAANFGPISLLSAVSSAVEVHGTLDDGREIMGDIPTGQGDVRYAYAQLKDGYAGILSRVWNGKLAVERALISTTPERQAPTFHYHLRATVTGDGITTANDVRHFLALAEELSALSPELKAKAEQDKFLKSFDATDRVVDAYVTQAGLQSLVDVAKDDPQAVIRAHAAAYEHLDRPTSGFHLGRVWKETPWLAVNERRYPEVMELLRQGPGGAHGPRDNGPTREQRYGGITGRSLSADAAAYREGQALLELLKQVGATDDPGTRIHLFAQRERELGLEFSRGLATIARLAGPEAILVNEFGLRDHQGQRSIVFASEGAIQDPRGEIEARPAQP